MARSVASIVLLRLRDGAQTALRPWRGSDHRTLHAGRMLSSQPTKHVHGPADRAHAGCGLPASQETGASWRLVRNTLTRSVSEVNGLGRATAGIVLVDLIGKRYDF